MTTKDTSGVGSSTGPGGAGLPWLLARARLAEVVASVASSGQDPSVWHGVHALDAAIRLGDAALSDIEAMADRLASTPFEEEVRPWLAALRAEHLLWRADLRAVSIAAPLIELLPSGPLVPLRLLVPRARVRRIMGLAAIFGGERVRSAELLADAAADFALAGWPAERSLTLALHAVLHVGVFMDDFELMSSVLSDAMADLEELGSPLVHEVTLGAAAVALAAGEPQGMWRALDRLRPIQGTPTLAGLGAGVLRCFAVMLGAGCGEHEVAELARSLAELRRRYPQPARMLTVSAAHVFCDLGRSPLARAWGEVAEHGAEGELLGTRDRGALRFRLRLLEGDPTAMVALWPFLEGMRRDGLARDAAAKAVRMAADCRRTGLHPEAAALEMWSRQGRPRDEDLTVWEAWWTAEAGGLEPQRSENVEVRLLDTHASVVGVRGVRRLKGNTARLLVVLVAAGGEVGTEALIDRLWPDTDLDAGRNRLNVTVHRLRRVLGGGRSVISRTRGAVWFAPPPEWKVDVWEFRRLARGERVDRLAAVELYHDHLCSQQLACDELVVGERLVLEALCARLLAQLADDPGTDPVWLAEQAVRLRVDDPALVDSLGRRLSREGHGALAAQVLATLG